MAFSSDMLSNSFFVFTAHLKKPTKLKCCKVLSLVIQSANGFVQISLCNSMFIIQMLLKQSLCFAESSVKHLLKAFDEVSRLPGELLEEVLA